MFSGTIFPISMFVHVFFILKLSIENPFKAAPNNGALVTMHNSCIWSIRWSGLSYIHWVSKSTASLPGLSRQLRNYSTAALGQCRAESSTYDYARGLCGIISCCHYTILTVFVIVIEEEHVWRQHLSGLRTHDSNKRSTNKTAYR